MHERHMQVAGAGGSTDYPFTVNSNAFNNVIPAPGATGAYTVTSSYAPFPGNSLSPGTSAPTLINVESGGGGGGGATSVTQTLTPTNTTANAPVTVTGTITSPAGTTPTGTVTVTVSPSSLIPCLACHHAGPELNAALASCIIRLGRAIEKTPPCCCA